MQVEGSFWENVSQIFGFLIKDCIDIHKDVIGFCSAIEFDVISWLPKDGTVFGFVNMPLIDLRLFWCISARSMAFNTWDV